MKKNKKKLKKLEKEKLKNEKVENEFSCNVCGKKFSSKTKLFKHLKDEEHETEIKKNKKKNK